MGENEKEVCSTCIKECLTDQEVISCELCSNRFHRECLGYNKTQFKAITGLEELKWFCKSCNSKAKDTLSMIKMVMTRMDLLEERNKVLGSKNAALEKRVLKLEKSKEEEKSLVDTEQTNSSGENQIITQQIKTELRELKEIEDRKCNFIISNIPEHDTNDPDCLRKLERIGVVNGDEEKETVTKLISKLNISGNVEVTQAMRIPKRRDPEKTTPRLVLVTVGNVNMKKAIIENSRNVKKIEGWSSSYITPDLTKNQRDKEFELRREKRRRTEAGETDLIIRNGEIIKRGMRFQRTGGSNSG